MMTPSSFSSKKACAHLLARRVVVQARPGVLRKPDRRLRAQNSGEGRDLPKSWSQVVEWASKEFHREVDTSKPDEGISLAKAFMLLALEEEAALEVHPEMIEVLQSLPGLKLQSHASASTWSLERVDALAAEIKDLVMASVGGWEQQAAGPAAELADARVADTWAGVGPHTQAGRNAGAAGAGASPAAGAAATDLDAGTRAGVAACTQDASNAAATAGGAAASSISAEGPSHPNTAGSNASSATWGAGSDGRGATAGPSEAPPDFLQLPPGLFKAFPGQVVSAINEVLYERHGYKACNRYGNIRDAQLSRVLEGGLGCSPALSVLYLVVAQKLGIRMAVSLSLESGRYFVLYPLDEDRLSPLLLPSSPTTSSPSTSFPSPSSPSTSTNPSSPSAGTSSDFLSGHAAAQADTPPASAQADTSNASAQAETPPANAQGDATPASAQAETPPASGKCKGFTQPATAQGEKKTATAQGDTTPATAQGDPTPASVQGDTPSASESTPLAAPPAADSRDHDSSEFVGNTIAGNLVPISESAAGSSVSGGESTADRLEPSTSTSSSSSTSKQGPVEQGHVIAGGGNASERNGAERSSEGPSSLQWGSSSSSSSSSRSSSSSKALKMDQRQAEGGECSPATSLTKRCVIDPYGCGGLLELEEVCELFEVAPEVLLQPASQRQVLAALLARQMDAFFAKAVGCSASPASMVPLSVETALNQSGVQLSIGSVGVHALSCALAAAEKRMVLLPGNSEAQLKVALLHYFSWNFDDAYLELGTVLERERSRPAQGDSLVKKGDLLLEKVRLELMFKENRL